MCIRDRLWHVERMGQDRQFKRIVYGGEAGRKTEDDGCKRWKQICEGCEPVIGDT